MSMGPPILEVNFQPMKPIAILYEHPEWFLPLFAELDRRRLPYIKFHVQEHTFDPTVLEVPYSLVVNRVSAYPSTVSSPTIVFYVQQYLAYLERSGIPVINGHFAYTIGLSKALQGTILQKLGVRSPKSIAIHAPEQALAAAQQLNFPLLIKPNIGGSGAGIYKFLSAGELEEFVRSPDVTLGIDGTALVQEYLPARNQQILRVEILNRQFLYGLRLPIAEDSFNYCPANGCNVTESGLAVEAFAPPDHVIEEVKQILAASQADLGGVEYLVNDQDGEIYYYDINPLSNFVANAVDVVGFDPIVRFVDYLETRATDS